MNNPHLVDYIRSQLSQGNSREVITHKLLSQGWQQQDIIEANSIINNINKSTDPTPNIQKSETDTQPVVLTITQSGSENSTGEATKNKKSVVGFVFGLIGLVAWFIPLFGLPITITGLVLSIVGLKSVKRGLAITGIVLSSIGFLVSIVNASIGAYMGITGQHTFVNQFLDSNSQNTQFNSGNISDNISKTQFINQVVQKVKNQYTLPTQIDQVTKLVDITAEKDAVRYHYLLSDIDTSGLSNDYLKTGLIASICQDEDIKFTLNRDINMEYSYAIEGSEEKYFIIISRADCN